MKHPLKRLLDRNVTYWTEESSIHTQILRCATVTKTLCRFIHSAGRTKQLTDRANVGQRIKEQG